jgi:FkbM family methyltransferase
VTIRHFIRKTIPLRIKEKIKKLIGMKTYLKAKSYLGLDNFEEVNIVYTLFSKILNKHGVMIDVGAHFGGSLANFAFDGWRVFAFEPDNKNRKILTERFGDLKLVTIDNRAVSDKIQKGVQFYNSNVSTGISSLSCFHPSHKKSQLIDTTTLRRFIEIEDISTIDFLKIDTEGFDLMVLKGVPWEIVKPSVVVCEFEDRKTTPLGYKFHDLAKYLTGHGYHLLISEWYPVVEYGAIHRWRCFDIYPCELKDKNATGNIIAVKETFVFKKLLVIAKRYEEKHK